MREGRGGGRERGREGGREGRGAPDTPVIFLDDE
jgi:hypothetical protein